MRRTALALILACAPLAAQVDLPPRVGVGVVKKELSLADTIELALKRNLEIEIERTAVATAEESVTGARGFLDPRFRFSPLIEDRRTPVSSPLLASDGRLVEKASSANFYWDQRLPWLGSSFTAGVENGRLSSSNPFLSLTPYRTGRLTLSVTLPLIRGRRTDRDRSNLILTNKQLGLGQTQFELRVIDVVSRVQEAYWNVVAARQNIDVTAEAVALGREQLARTRRQIESGTLAPVEISAAEAELERRIDTWYASISLVTQVENALKLLTAGGREEPLWDEEIVPTEQSTAAPPEFDRLGQASELALSKRPELRAIGLQMESNEVQWNLARDQLKPQLNLIGGYATAGLAGTVSQQENPFATYNQAQTQRVNELSELAGLPPLPPSGFAGPPANQIGGLGQAWDNALHFIYPSAYAGLQFQWTAGDRAANAQINQSAITERRLRLQRDQVEQAIEAQVRNALQEIQTARQRITAAEASARAAQEKLESEIRLFQTGESTNFLVLTRQNELAESRRRVVLARLDFNKAVARAEQALGTTLEAHRILLNP